MARELRLTINSLRKGDSRRLLTACGTPLYVVGSCDLNINFSGLIVPHNVLIVCNLQENLILGSNFLSKNDVNIDYRLRQLALLMIWSDYRCMSAVMDSHMCILLNQCVYNLYLKRL